MNELMVPDVRYHPSTLWKSFYKGEWEVAVLVGGRGSGKTWNAANFCAFETYRDFSYKTLVIRDTKESIEESIYSEISKRFISIESQLLDAGRLEYYNLFNVQKSIIKCNANDIHNVITKGFRRSKTDQEADLKGFSDVDLVLIEEAEDIRDKDRVLTLLDTLRKEGCKVIIILNTPDLEHWIIKDYFNYTTSEEYKGYFNLTAKPLNDVCQVISSYLDNPHLSNTARKKYDAYKDPKSYRYNMDHYINKILGLAKKEKNVKRKFDLNLLALPTQPFIKEVEGVKFFEHPSNKVYSMAVDSSRGTEKGDYTAIKVREFGSLKEVCSARLRADEELTFNIVLNLLKFFNSVGAEVYVAPEINNMGVYITKMLKNNYPHKYIYQREYTDETKREEGKWGDFGWETNKKTRPLMVSEYSAMYNRGEIPVNDTVQRKEMTNFLWNSKNGRYEAKSTEHDDLLISDMICIQNMKFIARNR